MFVSCPVKWQALMLELLYNIILLPVHPLESRKTAFRSKHIYTIAIPMDSLPPDENRALPALSIYMWVGCAFATVIVAIRLITRIVLKHAAGWDDFFIGVSYVRLEPFHFITETFTNRTRSWPLLSYTSARLSCWRTAMVATSTTFPHQTLSCYSS